jgi:hypothetical protein
LASPNAVSGTFRSIANPVASNAKNGSSCPKAQKTAFCLFPFSFSVFLRLLIVVSTPHAPSLSPTPNSPAPSTALKIDSLAFAEFSRSIRHCSAGRYMKIKNRFH